MAINVGVLHPYIVVVEVWWWEIPSVLFSIRWKDNKEALTGHDYK